MAISPAVFQQGMRIDSTVSAATGLPSREAKAREAVHQFCRACKIPESDFSAGLAKLRHGNAAPDPDEIQTAIDDIARALSNSGNAGPAKHSAPAAAHPPHATHHQSSGSAACSHATGCRPPATAHAAAPGSVSGGNPGAKAASPMHGTHSNAHPSGGAEPQSDFMDQLLALLQSLGIDPGQIDRVLSSLPSGPHPAAGHENTGASADTSGIHSSLAGGLPAGLSATPVRSPQTHLNALSTHPTVLAVQPPGSRAGNSDNHVFTDPALEAEIARRQSTDPAGANALRELSRQPAAMWINGGPNDGRRVQQYMDGAQAAGKTGLLALYDIPNRDLNNYSKGGEATKAAYLAHARTVAASIGARKATVILEPDALMDSTRMDPAAGRARRQTMREAVDILCANPAITVRIAAGGPGWAPPSQVADLLIESGIGKARNFSVGESGFITTDKLMAYGDAVVSQLAQRGVTGVHYSVDTSRNGVETHGEGSAAWADVAGAAAGYRPTQDQDIIRNPNVSEFVSVKIPWQGDGRLAAPGALNADYAIQLVKNAYAAGVW